MKISYSKKRLYANLILGILWTILGVSYFIANEKIKWYAYATLILGVVYIAMFLFDYSQKYIEITKEKIKVNSIPNKEIELKEITEVKYYADEYTFKTPNKSLKINKSLMNKNQFNEFDNFFHNLSNELKKNLL